MHRFPLSKIGSTVAVLYLILAAVLFVTHIYSVNTNPADSGLSALPFFLLALPWVMAVPESWHALAIWRWIAWPLSWGCVLINAVIFYGVTHLVASLAESIWRVVRK